MKTLTKIIASLAGILIASDFMYAAISGTKHDLRERLNINQICQPCHIPHNAINAQYGPIWNHAITQEAFTRHNLPLTLSGNSKLCMSCHDGVTAVGSFGTNTGHDPIIGISNLGTDLTATHPIGVLYPSSGPYKPSADVAKYLEDGMVQCGSCHYAHGGLDNKFLRVTINGSALCQTCHTF